MGKGYSRSETAPTRLIPEWSGEGCCQERSLLTEILPDSGLDGTRSQRRGWSFG